MFQPRKVNCTTVHCSSLPCSAPLHSAAARPLGLPVWTATPTAAVPARHAASAASQRCLLNKAACAAPASPAAEPKPRTSSCCTAACDEGAAAAGCGEVAACRSREAHWRLLANLMPCMLAWSPELHREARACTSCKQFACPQLGHGAGASAASPYLLTLVVLNRSSDQDLINQQPIEDQERSLPSIL